MESRDVDDAALIDAVGAKTIAERLDISASAVRKWRMRRIPAPRREQVLALLPDRRDEFDHTEHLGHSVAGQAALSTGHEETESVRSVPPPQDEPPAPEGLVQRVPARRDPASGLYTLEALSAASTRAGRCHADLVIAMRRTRLAKRFADQADAEAEGLPPESPVRFYAARLLLLFVLDFPVLTMAFVAVAQVSPVVAATSAVALSLFLVLGAHALGGPLSDLARHVPAWIRSAIGILVILSLLGAIIWTSIDLRLKGFEVERLVTSVAGGGLVFGDGTEPTFELPADVQWTIATAAALVTIMATMFGIVWSYRQHGPQAISARAERAYQRALIRQARASSRFHASCGGACVAFLMMLLGHDVPVHAGEAHCGGKAVLAFVDATTAYDEHDRTIIVPAIEEMAESLLPDQRLVIATVRDRAESSRILLDRCVPGAGEFEWSISGLARWALSSPAEARAERSAFFRDVHDILMPELQATTASARTALVDTLTAGIDAAGQGAVESVWIYSDLLESVVVSADALLVDTTRLAAAATASFPDLEGIEVHVAGVGRYHDAKRRPLTPIEQGSLLDSWSGLIGSVGGRLRMAQ